jgi:tRNA pseudouridine32 synthase/23S rRNA pseudouridine746 synthase
MQGFPLDVLFIDGEALVVNKPAGLAVHPGPRTPRSLEDRLHELCFGFARRPTIVHRLDRDTSGCLLLARNPKAHKRFAAAFEAGQVEKVYAAVLDGVPEGEEGVVELPLLKVSNAEQGWRMVVNDKGKPAVTHWQVVQVLDERALVRFMPETGRTHQIRVHAASGIGVPILGDPVYGRGRGPTLLHALSLRLERAGKAPVEATAPLPAAFTALGFGDAV